MTGWFQTVSKSSVRRLPILMGMKTQGVTSPLGWTAQYARPAPHPPTYRAKRRLALPPPWP